jgi:RNA polymerase sigma-70 factor (ECF subfamily)
MESEKESNSREPLLTSLASKGDLEAFNVLVLKYQDRVYNLAHAILGDRDAAEDATQETFISAFQHMGNFRGGSFRNWLLRIATNTCYDSLRTLKRHPTVALFPEDGDDNEIESAPWLADPRPSPLAEMEAHDFSRTVYRRLDELPAAYRAVIALIDLDELDYAEAAQALGIPLGTVKSRLARARLRMKERLSQDSAVHSGFHLTNAIVSA